MKKVICCILPVLIVMLCACSSGTGEPELLYDYEKTVSAECPQGWTLELADGEGVDRVLAPGSTDTAYAGMSLNSYEESITFDEYLLSLAEGFEDFADITVAGHTGGLIIRSRTAENGEAGAEATFIADGRLYSLSYYASTAELFEQYFEVFESTVNTLTLIK